MSRFVKSTATSVDNFGKRSQIQTYEEFQTTRIEKMNLLNADIQAKKEQELRDLQIQWQDLTMQLSAAQAAMADDERDFVNRRESLITELQQIKTEADIKFSQAQVEFMKEKERIQKEHDLAFQELARSVPLPTKSIDPPPESDELLATKQRVKKFEGTLRKFKQASFNKNMEDDNELNEDDCQQLYLDRISQLESQKRDLIAAIKEDEQSNEERITELQIMLEDQESQFRTEVEEIQERMMKKEETYKININKLYTELEKVQGQRQHNMQLRKRRITDMQAQIEKVETEFRQKLKDASRVAEKLKTALMNSNIRKTQQLEVERQRSQEQQQLMKESFTLQQQMFNAEKELQKAKEESTLLRRELSSKIGPRRTASLFM